MSFSDLRFIFYFLPSFVLLHTLAPQRLRNVLLVAGSLVFYAVGAGARDTAVLCAVVLVNYLLGRWIGSERGELRTGVLFLGVALNLGCLFYFKYLSAALRLLSLRTGADFSFLRIVLPLGISFYVFQSISYLADVHRETVAPERNLINFAAYLLAFPQLLIGPILRYGDVREALSGRTVRRSDLEEGFELFVIGLGLKVLLADQLSTLWAMLERIGFAYISTPLAWFGAVGYSLQLYFDFCGYSLMAMGLGRMLALPIPRNFDQPYLSRSVSEFYRRWHITLGTWFRDYIYIPLGGSRRGTARTFLSLAAVWVLTGLWHGATLNFLLWGVLLLLFIVLEKLGLRYFLGRHALLSHLYLLFVIVQSWVVFRITDMHALRAYFCRLYPFFGGGTAPYPGDFVRLLSSYWHLFAIALFFCLPFPRRFYEKHRGSVLVWLPLLGVFFLSVYFIATASGSPFLYSRF